MSNYYSNTKYVSNSDLGELRRLMRGEPQLDRKKYFGFGNVVDAMLTEPTLLTPHLRMFCDHKGEVVLSKKEWEHAEEMVKHARDDRWVQMFLEMGTSQAEVYVDEHQFLYHDTPVTLPMRAKMDSLVKQNLIAADFKTTAAETVAHLQAALKRFDNDRQAALYMDLAGLDRFVFLGLSKKKNKVTRKHTVLRYVVQRGDPFYLAGLAKYTNLGFHYKYLVHDFNLTL